MQVVLLLPPHNWKKIYKGLVLVFIIFQIGVKGNLWDKQEDNLWDKRTTSVHGLSQMCPLFRSVTV